MNIFKRAALRLAGVTLKDLAALHPEAVTREILFTVNSDQGVPAPPSNAYDEYAGQAWIYKATSTVARAFRSVPLYVMRGEEWIENHPVERLLAKPNQSMTGSALWEQWVTDLYLAGESGIEFVTKQPNAGMWLRNGHIVYVNTTSDRYPVVASYTIKERQGESYSVPPESFMWARLYNPLNPWRGLGVYQAAALGVTTDKAAQKYAASFFRGMARPDYVVTTPQGVTQTEKDTILAQIEAMTQGKNRGIVMEQGVTDIKALSFAPKDLIWETIRAMTREEIGAVAGVPGELMGTQSATYQNRREAVKSFWYDTIRPLCDWRDELVTEQFRAMGAIRPDETIETDYSDVEALEQSYGDRLNYAVSLTGLGVTLRDVNEMLDLGIPDASLAAAEATPEPVAPMPADMPAPAAEDQPEPPQKAMTRDDAPDDWPAYGSDGHKAMIETWEKALGPREARMRAAVRDLFDQQRADVLRRLGAGKTLGPPVLVSSDEGGEIHRPLIIDKTIEDAARNPFDMAKWVRLFRIRLSPHIRLALAEAGRDAMSDLGIGVSFDVSEPRVLDYIREREKLVKGINETTFEALKASISQGIDAGESVDKIAARVQEQMGPIADGRAQTIARTEVVGASNGGKLLAWQQSGVVTGKRWVASVSHMSADDPHPVRDSHESAHGQIVDMGEDFEVGDGHGPMPGQIGLPEEDINCRCTAVPITGGKRSKAAIRADDSEEDDNEMGYKQPTINVTVSPIINMPDVKPTFKFDMPEALTIPAPQVTVNVPEQAAPIVNVAAPIVNMPEQKVQPAPIVNVSAPRATSQTQKVNRDDKGNIISTTTTITYAEE